MIIIDIKQPIVNIPISKITDFSKLVAIYWQAVQAWVGICANCKCFFHKHDTYKRKTPLYGVIFRIKRVYCPCCGKSHALIPCFIFPYSRVLAHIKEAAIRGICYETHTIEQLAEIYGLEPYTIKRWWRNFRAASDGILKWLAKKLAYSNQPANWVGWNYNSTRAKGQKFFSLFGLYRSTYHPESLHSDFELLCLINHSVF